MSGVGSGGFVKTILLVYAGLFPIVNPLGSAPIYLSLTRRCSSDMSQMLAGRVAFNSLCLLLGSLFVGSYALEFFGFTLPVLRIAGGLVVAAFGWQLLQQRNDVNGKHTTHSPREDIDSFYPLTMPLTVGPGSISVAVALGSQRPALAAPLADVASYSVAAIVGLVGIAATIFVCYRFAGRIVAGLGPHGTDVMVRLCAFILLCIGIQIIWSGYSTLIITNHS
jgi:multiple antibiotic resistance protein